MCRQFVAARRVVAIDTMIQEKEPNPLTPEMLTSLEQNLKGCSWSWNNVVFLIATIRAAWKVRDEALDLLENGLKAVEQLKKERDEAREKALHEGVNTGIADGIRDCELAVEKLMGPRAEDQEQNAWNAAIERALQDIRALKRKP